MRGLCFYCSPCTLRQRQRLTERRGFVRQVRHTTRQVLDLAVLQLGLCCCILRRRISLVLLLLQLHGTRFLRLLRLRQLVLQVRRLGHCILQLLLQAVLPLPHDSGHALLLLVRRGRDLVDLGTDDLLHLLWRVDGRAVFVAAEERVCRESRSPGWLAQVQCWVGYASQPTPTNSLECVLEHAIAAQVELGERGVL